MELRDYLRVVRAHWLGMVLIVAAALLTTFGWALLQPKVYTADATAIVQAKTVADDLGSQSVGNTIANQKVKTYVELGSSRAVAEIVIDELGLDRSPSALVGDVSVSNPLNTTSLRVSAEASSPQAARDIAEAWVRGMAAVVNELETSNATTTGAVYLSPVDSARLPESPSSPNMRLVLAIGGFAGIVLAVGYGLLRHTLDRRIRSVDAVERETGVAVVGTVPEEKTFTVDNRLIPFDGGNSSGSANAHLFSIAEAMRELRTNIQYMDVDNPPRVMVVTSPLPGDGKSTTASNLAITLASSGQRVALIDGDLRRPMIDTIFGLPRGAGLSDVLAGRADLADVAHRVGAHGRLLVIGAGKIPPNPSEVLGSQRMKDLLDAIAAEAIVIIDAPPLIPVTDASVLAHRADGAIVVSTIGKTTYEVLGKALGNLERAGARALGIVLNRVPKRGAGAAYYGYQYHGDYYRAPDETLASDEAPASAESVLGRTDTAEGTRGAEAPDAPLRRSTHRVS
ncbi:polysaccharide biosynthesis tyrosine autokinase [Microbacterium esteraromaticum]|uniref:polysaccharide biosynthesis tyrosine autokinase n=1 Tax=Microbacterium esteraromaticum TaxID=57043 RepID=UPI001CD1E3F2|nr:polysaccharide biosynthesis tyrosine autokinase [Microbacterium esteraromaticum]MCA1305504.1 polysaccharide biosynthesis tyrosine autokinase [Microbacterium esteraromaticum]